MKLTRLLMMAAAVLIFSSGIALADVVDPVIGVKGGGGGSILWGDGTGAGSISIFFDPITPGVTCSGGVCDYVTPSSGLFGPFFITSGSITDFEYSFDQLQNTGFSVAADSVFPTLTILNDVSSSNPIAFLSGGSITPAPIITLTLFSPLISASNSVSGDFLLEAAGVVEGTTGTFTSNVPLPVPEPASIALMLSGLGALGVRRLRRAKKAAGANLAA